jgi:hypothetical protein
VTIKLTVAPGPGSASVHIATSNGTATAGSDYTIVNQDVVFGPADTQMIVSIPILNDTHYEPTETFTVTLSAPNNLLLVNQSNPAGVTLFDDDADSDGDGISDADEVSGAFGYVTSPANTDTDGDTIGDLDEITGRFGPPTNPTLADTDGDGVSDGVELSAGTDPTNPNDFPAIPALSVPLFHE